MFLNIVTWKLPVYLSVFWSDPVHVSPRKYENKYEYAVRYLVERLAAQWTLPCLENKEFVLVDTPKRRFLSLPSPTVLIHLSLTVFSLMV